MSKKVIIPILSGSFLSDGKPKGFTAGELLSTLSSNKVLHSSPITKRRYYYVLGDSDLPLYLSQLVNTIQFKDDIKELVRCVTKNRPLTRLINK